MKYKILFDNGKPFTLLVDSDDELKAQLKCFYLGNRDNAYADAVIYNAKHKDISETQFIEEMIKEILEECNK